MSITNPAICELHSMIRFLNAKIIRPSNIQRQLVKVYGECVQTWPGYPFIITEDLKDRADANVCENSYRWLNGLAADF
jgi:hypothetical protein